MIRLARRSLKPALMLVLFAVCAAALPAQEAATSGLGAQTLRPYRFMFAAYALAWLLVFGWVVSVGWRLARLDRSLGE